MPRERVIVPRPTEPARDAEPAPRRDPDGQGKAFEKFLNPQSMMTPGICGLMTVGITNTLAQNFAAPRAWIGLAISALFGLVVFVETRRPLERAIYYVLNTLIIFSMAFGAASAPDAIVQATKKVSAFSFVIPAFAQPAEDASRIGGAAAALASECANASTTNRSADLDRFCSEFLNGYRANSEFRSAPPSSPKLEIPRLPDPVARQLDTNRFFAPWKF